MKVRSEVGGNADEGGTNADGAELGAITSRVFVEGGEITRTKKGKCGRRKLFASDDAGKVEEGREAGKVRWAFRDD